MGFSLVKACLARVCPASATIDRAENTPKSVSPELRALKRMSNTNGVSAEKRQSSLIHCALRLWIWQMSGDVAMLARLAVLCGCVHVTERFYWPVAVGASPGVAGHGRGA